MFIGIFDIWYAGHGRQNKFDRAMDKKKYMPNEGEWEWGGCGDNVNFGFKKSRDFMDAPYRQRSDIKTLVKLHNNDAGRLVMIDPVYSASRTLI